jgi:two-component system, NtrC family, response regulator AtoC
MSPGVAIATASSKPARASPQTAAPRWVLLVDDDSDLSEVIVDALGPRGFKFSCQPSAEAALAALDSDDGPDWDVVVTDIRMDGMNGLALCERIVANFPNLPVVLMTAFGSQESAVAAVRAGAEDFVTKPFEMNVLALALDRAVRRRRVREEVRRLGRVDVRPIADDGIIGDSPPMRRVRVLIDRAAATDAPVLISGKSGTGKELVARVLHRRGRRPDGPFVAVSCAAIPEHFLESELFGYVDGAVPGVRTVRPGRFLEADGGTLFLDEIRDLPPALQSKLVRVLEDKVVRPVGGDRDVPFDARLLSATGGDLEAELHAHRFREDLFYRVHVIHIDLPPLHVRGNDVLMLARHFLRREADRLQRPIRGFSRAVAEKLVGYRWPGNVRELENCIERAVAVARTEELTVDDLPETVHDGPSAGGPDPGADPGALLSLEEVERRHILRVLAAVGSKSEAAAVLGLHPSTLYRKLEQYGHAHGAAE